MKILPFPVNWTYPGSNILAPTVVTPNATLSGLRNIFRVSSFPNPFCKVNAIPFAVRHFPSCLAPSSVWQDLTNTKDCEKFPLHTDPSMTSTKKLRMLPSRSSKRTPYWRRAAKPSGQLPSMATSLPEPASRAAKRHASAPVPAISKPICLPQSLILGNKTAMSKSFFKLLPFIIVHFNGVLHTRKCILFNLSFKSTKSFPHLLSQVGIAFYKLGSKSFKYSKQVMGS